MATEKKKIFLAQTVRVEVLYMHHHLVAGYRNASSYGPVVKIGPMLFGSGILDFP